MSCYKQILSTGSQFSTKIDPIFQDFSTNGCFDTSFIEKNATQRVVKPTRSSVFESFEKCNVKVIDPTDLLEDYVYTLVREYLYSVLHVPVSSVSDSAEFHTSTSPGKRLKRQGFSTKGDALKSLGFQDAIYDFNLPIYDVNPKIEILPLDEIKSNKVRTTFNPPLDFLCLQKLLYDNQNVAIVENSEYSWIKYGFSKEYGGMDRIGLSLEKFEYVEEDDGRGYDRSVLLERVYKLRNELLICPSDVLFLVDYVTEHTVHPLIGCPDGVIRKRLTGNNSGSNNTCSDNSIKHIFILFRLACKAFFKHNLRWPSLVEILDFMTACVYSDDSLIGVQLSKLNLTPEEWRELKAEVYAEYGIPLKPSQHYHTFRNIGDRIDVKHSFLGSSFHFDTFINRYVPFPRVEKICSSLMYFQKKLSPANQLLKFLAIQLLSTYVPELNDITRQLVEWYLPKVKDMSFELRAEVQRLNKNPVYYAYIILGREASHNRVLLGLMHQICGFKTIMQKVERAKALLDKVAAKVGMSEAGKEWLIAAIDPMHDTDILCCGYPDRETGPSVCLKVKQSVNIQLPVGLPTTANWNFSAILDDTPVLGTSYGYSRNGNSLYLNATASGNPYPTGGVQIVAFDNSGLVPMWQYDNTHNFLLNGLDVTGQVTSSFRVISQGMEVVNTTAELYKSGTITVWEEPTSTEEDCAYSVDVQVAGGAYIAGTANLVWDRTPPNNQAQALLMKGTQQWEASKGAYVVSTMNTMENIPSLVSPIGHIATTNELTDPVVGPVNVVTTDWVNSGYAITPNWGGTLKRWAQENNMVTPFNRKGILCTGLTPNSTFTLNYNVILEVFPTYQSAQLVLLAKPSPSEDYMALELYSKAVREFPVGVMFGANGLGDWILGCVDSIADTAAELGKPIMGAIEGYRTVRKGNSPMIMPQTAMNTFSSGGQLPQRKILKNQQKSLGAGRAKKSGAVVQGPSLPTGSFRSQQAKTIRKQTKSEKKTQ